MNQNDGVFGGSWLFAFLIIALLVGGNGGGLFGGNNNVSEAVNAAVNNQSTQNGLRDILIASANGNYETLKSTNDQTMVLMQQNNANLINAIQGYNALGFNMAAQNAELRQQIADLGYRMESCCCGIKTQMLQDKYEALARRFDEIYTDKSNSEQSAYLLNVMGKWIANPAAAST